MASWRNSAKAAAELEMWAWVEKWTKSNSGERQAEEMESEVKAPRGKGDKEALAKEVVESEVEGLLKILSFSS